MKHIQPYIILLTLCSFLASSGCGNKEGATPPVGGTLKKIKLAFVSNNASSFWTIARAGTADAVKELGDVEVDFRIPSSGQAAEQRQLLDDLLAKGIDGIAVSPIDPANQTEFLNKVASQTLLICHDSDAPNSKRVCYIGTDNTAAGTQAGKLIKEALPNLRRLAFEYYHNGQEITEVVKEIVALYEEN